MKPKKGSKIVKFGQKRSNSKLFQDNILADIELDVPKIMFKQGLKRPNMFKNTFKWTSFSQNWPKMSKFKSNTGYFFKVNSSLR